MKSVALTIGACRPTNTEGEKKGLCFFFFFLSSFFCFSPNVSKHPRAVPSEHGSAAAPALRRSTVVFWGCFSREVNGAVGNDASRKKKAQPSGRKRQY